MRLSEHDKQTIVNALRLAAEMYARDAQMASEQARTSINGPDGCVSRLAEQFERQAVDAKRLADEIENDEFARETLREHREAGLGSAMP